MDRPKFSVVIPTRLGHATLGATLRTCLDQDYDDYEVVVADNASLPETRAVVDSFASDRIKYFRHDEPLAMTTNWNKALSYARGEWITFIGDDDALLPGALRRLEAELAAHPSIRAVRWPWCTYSWPVPDSVNANKLRVPLFEEGRVVSSRERLAGMLATGSGPIVPHTYHAATHSSLVEAVTANGSFFSGPCPDLSSGVAAALFADRFLELGLPQSVLGFSQRSNTLANNSTDPQGNTVQDFHEHNARAGLRVHDELPDLIELPPISYWDALFRARDRFPTRLDGFSFAVPAETIAQAALDSITLAGQQRVREVDTILEWWRRTNPDSTYEPVPPHPDGGIEALVPIAAAPGIFPDGIVVDGSALGVCDVAGAAAVAAMIVDLEPILRPIANQESDLRLRLEAEHAEAAAQRGIVLKQAAAWDEKDHELAETSRQLAEMTQQKEEAACGLLLSQSRLRTAEAELNAIRQSRTWRWARRMGGTATTLKRPFTHVNG